LVLDAVIGEAVRRGYRSMQLWTDEADNERAQRLYRSRGFSPTGRRWIHEDALIGEWEAPLPSATQTGRSARPSSP
jgi:ribosomal protein S18 acetylase RimI-like enzyme